jgi:hypothetical protein
MTIIRGSGLPAGIDANPLEGPAIQLHTAQGAIQVIVITFTGGSGDDDLLLSIQQAPSSTGPWLPTDLTELSFSAAAAGGVVILRCQHGLPWVRAVVAGSGGTDYLGVLFAEGDTIVQSVS